MKKLIIFVFILVGIASCQKEVIRPNSPNTGNSYSTEKSGAKGNNDGSTNSNDGSQSINNGTSPILDDHGNPIIIDGEITDPLRKRDKN